MEQDLTERSLDDIIASSSLCDSEQSSQSSQKDGKKYFESDGEIGYRKGQSFIPVTNFFMRCKGYVASDSNTSNADGFLVEIIPKDTVRSTEDAINEGARGMRWGLLSNTLHVKQKVNVCIKGLFTWTLQEELALSGEIPRAIRTNRICQVFFSFNKKANFIKPLELFFLLLANFSRQNFCQK